MMEDQVCLDVQLFRVGLDDLVYREGRVCQDAGVCPGGQVALACLDDRLFQAAPVALDGRLYQGGRAGQENHLFQVFQHDPHWYFGGLYSAHFGAQNDSRGDFPGSHGEIVPFHFCCAD